MVSSVPLSDMSLEGGSPAERSASVAPPQGAAAGLGTRDDIALDDLIDGLRRTVASLVISVKTCRRGSDNPVFRMSAEQQFDIGLGQLEALLALPAVAHSEPVAARVVEEVKPFLEIAPQLTWTPVDDRVKAVFAKRAGELYAPDRLRKEGRPVTSLQALLATRATIPSGEAAAQEVSHAPEPAAAEAVILHETVFTFGDGSHQHLVGVMYLAYAVHVRGLSQQDAAQSLSPAALLGFAQSLEGALTGHVGPVAFRIVRQSGAAEPQLHRLATPPAKLG